MYYRWQVFLDVYYKVYCFKLINESLTWKKMLLCTAPGTLVLSQRVLMLRADEQWSDHISVQQYARECLCCVRVHIEHESYM